MSRPVLGGPVVEAFYVHGQVGGNVSIRCSHWFAQRNVKFFCNASCEGQDILIQSDPHHNPSVSGRFSLYDRGTGAFVVTMLELKVNDSGRYWCGVKRRWYWTYRAVDLIVSDGKGLSFGRHFYTNMDILVVYKILYFNK